MNKRMISALFASTCLTGACGVYVQSGQAATDDVQIVADDIGGVVTSSKGPEAGVWVIAETMDVVKNAGGPARYIKEVVTDDQGRYVVPDLPKGKYKVWVRGYGLVDSKPVDAVPGKKVDLKAELAPDARAAAQYYPAAYWFSLIHPPAANEFPGTGADGNGIAPTMTSQQVWVATMKEFCGNCHQFGDKATRELANSTPEGWATRIQMARPEGDQAVGNQAKGASQTMQNTMARYGLKRALAMYADWTTRVKNGEYPKEAPPRPVGVERNVVLTIQDWGNGRFVHDTVSTNRDDPTVNAYGPIYGGANFAGAVEVFNPKTHMAEEQRYGYKAGGVVSGQADIDIQPHSADMDAMGRVWISDPGSHFSEKMGPGLLSIKRPDFCAEGSDNKFAKYFPPDPAQRQRIGNAVVWDPKTKQFTGITTCFGIHHDHFDKNGVIYYGGDPGVFGWFDTKVWDATHDAQKAMGWCPMVLNTKEKGVTKVALGDKDDLITPDRKQWNQPGQPRDPKKDTRMTGFGYGMDINPVDGSVWYGDFQPQVPSGILRFERGSNPPETCKTEYYEPPKLPDGTYVAFNGRGMSIDSKGIAWIAFGSGKFGRFDRSKCKVLSGPTATGQQCPEGWKFYDMPGPKMAVSGDVGADWYYTDFVDRYDTLGLGADVPIATAAQSDSLVAMMPDTGKAVVMRVPYPLGFYSRIVDGRIDDAKAGWKGRGLWATYSMVPVWHQEGGADGDGPQLVHFQLRPDPLAH